MENLAHVMVACLQRVEGAARGVEQKRRDAWRKVCQDMMSALRGVETHICRYGDREAQLILREGDARVRKFTESIMRTYGPASAAQVGGARYGAEYGAEYCPEYGHEHEHGHDRSPKHGSGHCPGHGHEHDPERNYECGPEHGYEYATERIPEYSRERGGRNGLNTGPTNGSGNDREYSARCAPYDDHEYGGRYDPDLDRDDGARYGPDFDSAYGAARGDVNNTEYGAASGAAAWGWPSRAHTRHWRHSRPPRPPRSRSPHHAGTGSHAVNCTGNDTGDSTGDSTGNNAGNITASDAGDNTGIGDINGTGTDDGNGTGIGNNTGDATGNNVTGNNVTGNNVTGNDAGNNTVIGNNTGTGVDIVNGTGSDTGSGNISGDALCATDSTTHGAAPHLAASLVRSYSRGGASVRGIGGGAGCAAQRSMGVDTDGRRGSSGSTRERVCRDGDTNQRPVQCVARSAHWYDQRIAERSERLSKDEYARRYVDRRRHHGTQREPHRAQHTAEAVDSSSLSDVEIEAVDMVIDLDILGHEGRGATASVLSDREPHADDTTCTHGRAKRCSGAAAQQADSPAAKKKRCGHPDTHDEQSASPPRDTMRADRAGDGSDRDEYGTFHQRRGDSARLSGCEQEGSGPVEPVWRVGEHGETGTGVRMYHFHQPQEFPLHEFPPPGIIDRSAVHTSTPATHVRVHALVHDPVDAPAHGQDRAALRATVQDQADGDAEVPGQDHTHVHDTVHNPADGQVHRQGNDPANGQVHVVAAHGPDHVVTAVTTGGGEVDCAAAENARQGSVYAAARIRWNRYFALLIRYKKQTGHCNPPHRFNSPEYPHLGKWTVQQRRTRTRDLRRMGPGNTSRAGLAAAQVNKLDALGFVWSKAAVEHVQPKDLAQVPSSTQVPHQAPDAALASVAKPATANTAKPAPANTAKPAPANTTKPAPANTAKPSPANTAVPAPANTAKPAPVNAAVPAPHDTAKPQRKVVRALTDAEEEKLWTACLAAYMVYIQRFGTHVVHVSYSTSEFPGLGAWVHKQKVAWWNEIARLNGEIPHSAARLCMRRRELLSAAGATALPEACRRELLSAAGATALPVQPRAEISALPSRTV